MRYEKMDFWVSEQLKVDIKQEKECAEHLQAILLEASMYSDPHAKTHKLITFLIPEVRQIRLLSLWAI